jgi:hypothetical protein
MYKAIDVGSWDFQDKTASIVPVSSQGLTGRDRFNFFEKRAAAITFKKELDNLKLASGDIPVHLIAVGATEFYNCNKNGDGFCEQTCRDRHHTFVKNASVYRHHANSDKSKRYGKVAASAYNDDMHRIELLVVLNGTKQAAARNGGLVIPDDSLQKLASGDALPWSMGCRVSHDVCNNCFNKAASPKDYCQEHECINPKTGKKMFGCKKGLTKVAEDGAVQYVENPNCTYMDISEVTVPADRTAFGYVAKYAAAAGRAIGGAELAEAYGWTKQANQETVVRHVLDHPIRPLWSDTLTKLAAAEYSLREHGLSDADRLQQWGFFFSSGLPDVVQTKYAAMSEGQQPAFLMHLADHQVILSPKQYAKLANADSGFSYLNACQNLFGMIDQADCRELMLGTMKKYAMPVHRGCLELAGLIPPSGKFTKQGAADRITELVFNGVINNDKPLPQIVKVASAPSSSDYKTAIDYILYKIAAVSRLQQQNENTYLTAVLQQFI